MISSPPPNSNRTDPTRVKTGALPAIKQTSPFVLSRQAAAQSKTGRLVTNAPLATHQHTILIVDDEMKTRQLLETIFRQDGYQVITAHSAEEALQGLTGQDVSLVISDDNLPGMSGTEFLKRVRQDFPNSFRLLLAASNDLQVAVNAINEGHIFYYITKPWNDDELKMVVRNALQRYELGLDERRLRALIVQQSNALRTSNELLEQKVQERTAEVEANNRALETTLVQMVQTLHGLLEAHGIGQKGHSMRVSEGCDWVAARLGLGQAQRLEIQMAASLHDLGKVSLPQEILKKNPLSFSRAEAAMYREFPMLGQSLLSNIKLLEGVGKTIYHQREWYNGTGYPAGLSGDNIPLGSRIIAVIDWYEERHDYEDIQRNVGHRFDPNVVKVFGEYLEMTSTSDNNSSLALLPDRLQEGMMITDDVYTGRGLLLVTRGKVVDKATLEKIRNFNAVDPIVGTIYVRK
ncbi:MAG: HD domain-containing phosphohydrolase [Chloroflexota bacterium]